MSGYRLDAPAGSWIDRAQPLSFTFDGRAVAGFEGDTVASALLAAGIVHVGRSFKLHRPRGVFSCGIEEPTAIVDVGDGASRTPVTRATDVAAADGLVVRVGNAWPSLGNDLAALNARFAALLPAGFYYKTFKWPDWHWFEPMIRRMAGLGHAASEPDPDRYDEVSARVDTLVVGGGTSGVAAALDAARADREVWLVESSARLEGDGDARLEAAGVRVLSSTCAFGAYDHGLVCALQTLDPRSSIGIRERLLKLQARHVVVAAGAYERPLLFPDNDRPGVMLASAVERHARRYGVACGRRVVVATAGESGWRTARALRALGVEVVAIVDPRKAGGSDASDGAGDAPEGAVVHRGARIVTVHGTTAVHGVTIASADGRKTRLDCDCIASAGGWTPAVNLWSMAGGKLHFDARASMFVPTGSVAGMSIVGAAAGEVEESGSEDDAAAPMQGGKVFVDLQNDVTVADVELAARENYRSVEHLKRYTTLGMATDQGKTSNVNAILAMARATGRTPGEVGTTRFRPPVKPVTLNALAAGRTGERYRPLKRMPGHAFHAERGAAFEDFAGWLRPAAYPRAGEGLVEAAEREAAHVRAHVGLFDQSPLGKIEVAGPDAATFLDLMYVGTMSTLPVGSARYGLLLNELGVIVDDGIVARLAPDRFWVNTTSGGADRVALAFDEWLQCEYVSMRVAVVPVTTSWANVTVAGPKAWALLEAAGVDAGFAPRAMAHMTMREGVFDGVRVRVLRASFSGELCYELNVPALFADSLLRRLADAGHALDVQPYGVEAVMILRLEKGFLHVGADTDGTTLPGDVDMDRAVARKAANFVGRRSLALPAARDEGRMQLVGLVPVDRQTRLPVGAHVAATRPPADIDGVVTSSAWSPALGHPIALAMLRRGRSRIGERVALWHADARIEAEVTTTPFFDPEGARLRDD
jgi:sarcosine oxidase subunit alpha